MITVYSSWKSKAQSLRILQYSTEWVIIQKCQKSMFVYALSTSGLLLMAHLQTAWRCCSSTDCGLTVLDSPARPEPPERIYDVVQRKMGGTRPTIQTSWRPPGFSDAACSEAARRCRGQINKYSEGFKHQKNELTLSSESVLMSCWRCPLKSNQYRRLLSPQTPLTNTTF